MTSEQGTSRDAGSRSHDDERSADRDDGSAGAAGLGQLRRRHLPVQPAAGSCVVRRIPAVQQPHVSTRTCGGARPSLVKLHNQHGSGANLEPISRSLIMEVMT